MEKTAITTDVIVNAPVQKVFNYYTKPEHIIKWNAASEDWHTPRAENDLRPGGNFVFRMEAKDGSFGFDFGGVYDAVTPNEYIEYTLGDGRKVKIDFAAQDSGTKVTEIFEAETQNPVEMQKNGWQSILNSFKKYTESN
jgi:uncharacterized protein YndB with AHSA1/START domain